MAGWRLRSANWPAGDRRSSPVFHRRRRHPSKIGRRYRDDDEEAALGSEPPSGVSDFQFQGMDRAKVARRTGFKDSKALLAAEHRRADLKRRVLDGMRGFSLEELDRQTRKSDAELKRFRNKKVRRFYRAQNETLDAWLEVDALVYAVADDIIDSMVSSNCSSPLVRKKAKHTLTRRRRPEPRRRPRRDRRASDATAGLARRRRRLPPARTPPKARAR